MYPYIMLRTQISLTERDAVDAVYGSERSADSDLAAMRRAFGSWKHVDSDGASWVDGLRSGRRLEDLG